jgi:thiamine biosynthesis lipoprotein
MVQFPIVRIDRPASFTSCVHEAMATQWEFWLSGHDPDYLRQAAQAAFARIDELEDKLSLYRESSDVSRINAARSGAEVRVGDETRDCLLLALRMSALTRGAFHAFLGFSSLRAKGQALPAHLQSLSSQADNLDISPVVGISESGNLVHKLREGSLLDLGALGKGCALDLAAATLEEWEISQACLIAGGSSVLALDPPDGIRGYTANLPGREVPLCFSRIAFGASGLGFQPAHIVNPHDESLRPLHNRAYATAPSAAEADALSTAAMNLPCDALRKISIGQPQYSFLVRTSRLSPADNWFSSGRFFGSSAEGVII